MEKNAGDKNYRFILRTAQRDPTKCWCNFAKFYHCCAKDANSSG